MTSTDIEQLAEEIAPWIVQEYGPRPNAETRATGIEAYLTEHSITLAEQEMELLMDEVKDLAPTY